MGGDRAAWFRANADRGSFIVGMVILIFLFLVVAAMGVDMGRYFYTQQQNQNIADGATLAAAQAFNQVRSLSNIDRSALVEAGFRYIGQQKGYDTDAYELSPTFKAGDVWSDTFLDAEHSGVVGDTYIRVGLNVKYYFEPYFLPRYVFGDEFFAVQSQAVAELHPVFWQSNLYDPIEPGPPIPPLRYSIYSKSDIKPESMDCFYVEGDLHTDSGYFKAENMQSDADGSDCLADDGTDDWGAGDVNFRIRGDIEVGDQSGVDDTCSGQEPPAGCGLAEYLRGSIDGEFRLQDTYNCPNTPCPTIDTLKENQQVDPVSLPEPPPPPDDPDQYPGPICHVTASDTYTANDETDLDFTGSGGNDCSDGGTLYVENGALHLNGFSSPTGENEYSFVADSNINVSNPDSSSLSEDQLFIYSRNSYVKVNKIGGDAHLNTTIYAPDPAPDWSQTDLCNPIQPGCVKIENSSHDLTIDGGVVAGTLAKFEQQDRLRFLFNHHQDILPEGLRTWVRRNDVPDYWQVHLIH